MLDKVSQKIIRHVGQAVTDMEVEELKKLAQKIIVEMKNQRNPVLPIFAPEDIYGDNSLAKAIDDKVDMSALREEQRIIEGIGDVFGKLYEDISLIKALGDTKKDSPWNEILKACVLARIANPISKYRTASMLEQDYGIRIALEKIYRMMDRLVEHESGISKTITSSTLELFGSKLDVAFFDVTTLYFESVDENELHWVKEFSHDQRRLVVSYSSKRALNEIITRYRGLWSIKESFRISKHDLKMRPIYHWTPERISSHILICFIAYALVRQAMYRVRIQYEPMSFEKIWNEFLHTQASILLDTATNRKYILPSKTTPVQKRLYHIFGLKRSEVPRRTT